MKKSIIFLINGLGIEKPGSYSISIDEVMPKLSHTKETSFFQTAITSSLEPKGAYQQFFLGDTYGYELNYIKENILNENLKLNPTYQALVQSISKPNTKFHIFVEPTNNRVVNEINELINTLSLEKEKGVYLHLILPQLTLSDYKKLISIVNYIKFHLNDHITVGFVIGKETLKENPTKDMIDVNKKMFFLCSTERWTETEKKLESLRDSKILPCNAPGFTATNACKIENGDTILFFNTRRANYDNYLNLIYNNASDMFKGAPVDLPTYSLIKLYSNYNIPSLHEKISYPDSLANILERNNKKALIITDQSNMNLINFYANGLDTVVNPRISFMLHSDALQNKEYIASLIDNTDYDLFIFDYYMDIYPTVNDIKANLEKFDNIIGALAEVSENKHSLFISSLYGMKKSLPVAPYNQEIVNIDYELQIPIFFYDYSYPRTKYMLFPGETNNILYSAIKCICNDDKLYSLVRLRGLLANLFGKK